MSQKRTVTVFRCSRGAAAGVTGAPHSGQNLPFSGISWPQAAQTLTPRGYCYFIRSATI